MTPTNMALLMCSKVEYFSSDCCLYGSCFDSIKMCEAVSGQCLLGDGHVFCIYRFWDIRIANFN